MTRHLTTVNLDPFLRNAIGVNNLFTDMLYRCETVNAGNFPPYNIIAVDDDHYEIEMAIAGFSKDNVDIRVENGELIVESVHNDDADNADSIEVNYIHHGIADRSFRRIWALADHVEVTDATLDNGILKIKLERQVPEALKPKLIQIK